MGRKPKFSKEVKVEACENYKNGNGCFRSIAKEVGCALEVMRQWYMNYCHYGPDAFDTSNRNRAYSSDFKMSVVELYISSNYSMAELGAKYNIAYGVVNRWINKYNGGIELKSYDPKGDVYTMKSRKTTFEERLKIVEWIIENDMNYKGASEKFAITYALVYRWTQSYIKDGIETLKYKKRGPKSKSIIDESNLSEIEKLKLELKRERALRKRREFELEVLKKKEEFEKKNRSRE